MASVSISESMAGGPTGDSAPVASKRWADILEDSEDSSEESSSVEESEMSDFSEESEESEQEILEELDVSDSRNVDKTVKKKQSSSNWEEDLGSVLASLGIEVAEKASKKKKKEKKPNGSKLDSATMSEKPKTQKEAKVDKPAKQLDKLEIGKDESQDDKEGTSTPVVPGDIKDIKSRVKEKLAKAKKGSGKKNSAQASVIAETKKRMEGKKVKMSKTEKMVQYER